MRKARNDHESCMVRLLFVQWIATKHPITKMNVSEVAVRMLALEIIVEKLVKK